MSNIFGGGGRPAVSPPTVAQQQGLKSIFDTISDTATGRSSSPSTAPVAPTPIAPPTMADPFSPASLEAQRKIQTQALQGGRSSTILTTRTSRNTSTSAGTLAGGSKLGSS
jgi:hypothetical protein